jgi:serine/threonine protein kinase
LTPGAVIEDSTALGAVTSSGEVMPQLPSADDLGLIPGVPVAGKYRVDRVLGAGGMGVVVAAHHLQLDEPVAIKFVHPQALGNVEALARFDREARALAKIRSEHVARVLDVGRLEDGTPFMVMEYLEGTDLSARLEKFGPLPVEEAVEYVLQVCDALAEAHSLGIVHRDLKPANLFCTTGRDGLPLIKVLDFGISKTGSGHSGSEQGLTSTRAVLGSPEYMSPEQIATPRTVDARTDIWSLGAILFEFLTGRVPFEADSLLALAVRIANESPSSLASLRLDAPSTLESVILKCLEKDRAMRYRHVGELAAALAAFAPVRARSAVDRIARIVQQPASAVPLPLTDTTAPPSARRASTTAGVARIERGSVRTPPETRGDRERRKVRWLIGFACVVGTGVGAAVVRGLVHPASTQGIGVAVPASVGPVVAEQTLAAPTEVAPVPSLEPLSTGREAVGAGAPHSRPSTAAPAPSGTARSRAAPSGGGQAAPPSVAATAPALGSATSTPAGAPSHEAGFVYVCRTRHGGCALKSPLLPGTTCYCPGFLGLPFVKGKAE